MLKMCSYWLRNVVQESGKIYSSMIIIAYCTFEKNVLLHQNNKNNLDKNKSVEK